MPPTLVSVSASKAFQLGMCAVRYVVVSLYKILCLDYIPPSPLFSPRRLSTWHSLSPSWQSPCRPICLCPCVCVWAHASCWVLTVTCLCAVSLLPRPRPALTTLSVLRFIATCFPCWNPSWKSASSWWPRLHLNKEAPLRLHWMSDVEVMSQNVHMRPMSHAFFLRVTWGEEYCIKLSIKLLVA